MFPGQILRINKMATANINFNLLDVFASRRGASDSITDSSVISRPVDAQNVFGLGLCGRDICPKSSA